MQWVFNTGPKLAMRAGGEIGDILAKISRCYKNNHMSDSIAKKIIMRN